MKTAQLLTAPLQQWRELTRRPPIASLQAPDLLPFLQKLQREFPETASRIRQRLDAIFEDAIFHRWATNNPAASLKRKLREAMKGKKRQRGHFAALPYAQAPGFMAKLRAREGIGARALEFAVLTASRTAEVLGATWDEFDGNAWTVPGPRMKGGEPHTVHLAPRALQIVESMRDLEMPHVFPAPSLNREPRGCPEDLDRNCQSGRSRAMRDRKSVDCDAGTDRRRSA